MRETLGTGRRPGCAGARCYKRSRELRALVYVQGSDRVIEQASDATRSVNKELSVGGLRQPPPAERRLLEVVRSGHLAAVHRERPPSHAIATASDQGTLTAASCPSRARPAGDGSRSCGGRCIGSSPLLLVEAMDPVTAAGQRRRPPATRDVATGQHCSRSRRSAMSEARVSTPARAAVWPAPHRYAHTPTRTSAVRLLRLRPSEHPQGGWRVPERL